MAGEEDQKNPYKAWYVDHEDAGSPIVGIVRTTPVCMDYARKNETDSNRWRVVS